MFSLASFVLYCALLAAASPFPRQSVSPVSTSLIPTFDPYTEFARAAYCSGTETWSCGGACTALPGFVPYVTGGDGDAVPHFFVGYWPEEKTAVVAHEGTDPTQLLSLLTDADFVFATLDSTLFPGLSNSIQVHSGFASAHADTATTVLSAVQQVLSNNSISSVTLVGHSLGGAIALLDSVYLPLHLPSDVTFKTVAYGLPRVGNPAFASYVDTNMGSSVTHITNMLDPIPTVPPELFGFAQPEGEIHIMGGDDWVYCPGDDNPSIDCSTGAVPTVLTSDILDHLGPYDNIWIGTIFC